MKTNNSMTCTIEEIVNNLKQLDLYSGKTISIEESFTEYHTHCWKVVEEIKKKLFFINYVAKRTIFKVQEENPSCAPNARIIELILTKQKDELIYETILEQIAQHKKENGINWFNTNAMHYCKNFEKHFPEQKR